MGTLSGKQLCDPFQVRVNISKKEFAPQGEILKFPLRRPHYEKKMLGVSEIVSRRKIGGKYVHTLCKPSPKCDREHIVRAKGHMLRLSPGHGYTVLPKQT